MHYADFLCGVIFGVFACGVLAYISWGTPKRAIEFLRGVAETARPEIRAAVDGLLDKLSREELDALIAARQEEKAS